MGKPIFTGGAKFYHKTLHDYVILRHRVKGGLWKALDEWGNLIEVSQDALEPLPE